MRFGWLILFLCLAPAALAAQQPSLEADLKVAEERLAAALLAKDVPAFEQLLAPDFVVRGTPDVDREAWIRNARDLCWGDAYTISDFRVTALPDQASAIVSLVLTTNRDPETCTPAVVRSLITDVWQRRQGGWQLTLRHSGPAGGLQQQFAKTAPPPPRWERSAELSIVATTGNSDTQTVGFAGSLVWRPGVWTTRAHASFVRTESLDIETARSFVADVRQSRAFSPRLDAFVRLETLTNEFAGIDHRQSVDGGVGYKLFGGPVHSLRTDAGFGYSHESRLTGPDLSFALVTGGASYKWQVSRTTSVSDDAVVTVSLEDRRDWRLSNTVALAATMTRALSLKLSHELKYVNAPVPGFETTDTILAASLVVKF